MSKAIWVNGQQEDSVSAFDRGLAYGDGLFATMRCRGTEVLFLESHLLRLAQGANRLGLPLPEAALTEQIAKACEQGAKQFSQDYCLKVLISRGTGGRGYMPPQTPAPTCVLSLHEIPAHYLQWQAGGIKLQVSQVTLGQQPLLAGMKHLNRLEQVLIRTHQLDVGFDDWLVCDTAGNIIEASMANLFFIKGGTIVTPSLEQAGVAGVMREQLLLWFVLAGFNLEVRRVSLEELAHFDHVLACNSLFGAVAVNGIAEHSFGHSPLIKQLLHDLKIIL
ncbi:aminodeoxychorismate lyase [Shewanella insulae]|uniref:aminodeoxychorismate lyase n=1 Tax=Shewanella insulae TaxID=2681496 RepID=UPI001EFE4BFC|nr:aminodeoxychorismate lyase [Shewanella insulae]MCG9711663.1 aminodeoxychorismate lyase [Shewanella insulae]